MQKAYDEGGREKNLRILSVRTFRILPVSMYLDFTSIQEFHINILFTALTSVFSEKHI